MEDYPDQKSQGMKSVTCMLAFGIAAILVVFPSSVLPEEFLIPSIIDTTSTKDQSNSLTFPSRLEKHHDIIELDLATDELVKDVIDLTTGAREKYHRLADELVANGMPHDLEPQRFAVRCIVAAGQESTIDPATVREWTELWYVADRLTFIDLFKSARTDRAPEFGKQLRREAYPNDTWLNKKTSRTCIDLAPKVETALRDIDQVYGNKIETALREIDQIHANSAGAAKSP